MSTLKETSQAYEPKKTKNIVELDKVDVSEPIEQREGTDSKGDKFTYDVLIRDGIEYRVPATVLEQIKAILAVSPNLEFVSVSKTGENMNTKYTVIPVVA
jgi:hypothetical protein